MKAPFLIITLLFSTLVYGQDIPVPTQDNGFKKLLLGANFSPNYCYRVLRNNDGSAVSDEIIALRNKSEKYKIGYSAGVNLSYNFSKHFGVEAGLQYANIGYSGGAFDYVFGDQVASRNGAVYSSGLYDLPYVSKIVRHHTFLDLPIRAILYFGKNKIRFVAGMGAALSFAIKESRTVIFEGNSSLKKQQQATPYDYNAFNFSPIVSAGIDYRLTNKWSLKLEPTFRYGLMKIIDMPVTAYLWTCGLNMSCSFAIN